ncbi:DNA adenine methylase [Listeria newyorkensis]|uniref:DNA adenine methylase n=1 Tax=Listeria newyorkensis TaxID=1497681 RepID=UPI00051DBC11|nr:DNA adenine methylase [Listeria newyorkensis]KGL44100.1 DNA methyltransferase [Listeria newyorkensis]SQC57472.1 Modification methylase DpnIIA [Listeria newyorkensis]
MRRILNYPGSKWRLADWIIENMPPHETYLEPFFGSGAVFFNKAKSKVETINDLDGRIVNMFQVMRNDPEKLAAVINATPYARAEYELSLFIANDPVEDARRMLVRCWFSIGGKTHSKSGFRKLVSANGPYVVQDWARMPETIIEAGNRLKEAQIENINALDLLQQHNRPEILIYADPPYLPSTRGGKHYSHEYTEQDHRDLLEVLKDHEGPVLLSGYESDLYKNMLSGWIVKEKSTTVLHGATRNEILYINKVAEQGIKQELKEKMEQINLFEEETQ